MIDAAGLSSLGEALRDALVQFKSNTALIEADRKRESLRLSYLDVKRTAMAVASRFEAQGIGAGDRVAILMSNQSKWPIAAYGALYRGAVLVPIDYKLTADEQRALLAHAKPKALVIEYPLLDRLGTVDVPLVLVGEAPEGKALDANVVRWESLQTPGTDPEFIPRARQDVATIVYSSGTGGRPKGCMLTHENYLSQYASLSSLYPLVEGDRYFSILPTNHAIDFMCGFLGPFFGGATVIHQRALRPEFLTWTMKEYRVTHMAIVPLILEAFENAVRTKLDDATPLQKNVFSALRTVNQSLTRRKPNHAISRRLLGPVHDAFGGELRVLFCGGAFVDRKRAEFFYDLGIPVAIGYGLTEACTVATVHDLRPFRADSVGRPVPGTEIRIVDPDAHGVGEVQIQGPTVMKGYFEEPELTAESFDGPWLRTGDLGWMDASGHLHLVGRSKNMIVTAGGKNVYPEDVEGAFDGVPCDELAVFASNYLWPGGKLEEESLVAVARVKSEEEPRFRDELLSRNRRLPEHKRIGGIVRWDDVFPRTASMKLKRGELAQTLRERTQRSTLERL
ncbi:MAG: AMP-binding protein [Myxococcales bacterium]|nr:AMP-binding protein [Myxococcales bacterium]